MAQMTKYPVFYPDVPSFIASLQKRHDSLLKGVDTSEPEGAALRVRFGRLPCSRSLTPPSPTCSSKYVMTALHSSSRPHGVCVSTDVAG